MANDFADLGFEPEQKKQDHSDIGFEPSTPAQAQPPQSDLTGDIGKAVENALPVGATSMVKDLGKRVFSAVQGVETNPNMQSLDSATKAGFVLQNTIQGVFDSGGEATATKLAAHGLNPYMAAGAGTAVAEIPDIIFSAEGIASIKAAGNAAAESEMLGNVFKKTDPLLLEHKPMMGGSAIDVPQLNIETGEPIPLDSNASKLLKGNKPTALPEPSTVEGQGFSMSENPDLAKLQQQDELSGQPKYPEDMGNSTTMRGYVGKRRLSSDVPDFRKVQEAVAPADLFNPAMSELVDESRKVYSGVDPRLQVVKDADTGKITFRLKQDPVLEKSVATANEHASNMATTNSAAVKEMGIDPRIVDSSPILPGSQTVPVIKEGIVAGSRSWMQDAWNRIGVSAEDAISRMGDYGQQLANGIRTMRDVPQVRYGEFSAGFDEFLKGASKKEAKEISFSLAESLEGRTPSKPLPKGMLEFVQQKLKVIADEAASVGLVVRNSSGETLPFAARENYFPRVLRQEIFDGIISGDNKVMKEVAEKMVANKAEPNYPVAFERVKYMRNKMMSNKYGHLEKAREFNLSPELYDRNSLRVIPEYINTALHRIEEVRQFGLEGEKALGMLSGMQDQGHDAQLARTIFERFTRIEPRDNVYLRGAQGLRNITAGMLIQAQSTVLQVGQAMMPAYEAGFVNAVKGFAKSFTALGEADAKRAGQVFTTAAQDYLKESYGGGSYGFGSGFADGAMKMSGFTRMDHFLRKYSAIVGQDYIKNDLAPNLLKGGRKGLIELQNLGFDTDKIIRNKGITADEVNVGAKRFADMTQGSPDVTRLPEFWTTWQGRLLGQFKNFSYVIGKQNVSMIKRSFQTGNFARLGEMAVGLPMTGYAIGKVREAMTGQGATPITGQEEIDSVINILGNTTAFGPSVDLFLQAMQGNLKNFFIPISVANVAEIAGSAGKSIKEGSLEPISKTLIKKTPVVGKMLYKKVYGD